MYGAIIKRLILAVLAPLPIVAVTACGSQKTENEEKAELLLAGIETLYSDKEYSQAITMIDSLMKSYPGLIDIQRKAMHMQTLITEKQTLNDSIENERIFAEKAALTDSLLQNFKFIKTEDQVEGYYVSKRVGTDELIKSTGIETRIDEKGNIYMVTSLYGFPIMHTQLSASAGDINAATTNIVPTTNPRNYRFKDDGTSVEMVTFNSLECDSLCSFIAKNAKDKIKLSFVGKSKTHSIMLPSKVKDAIAETYTLYLLKSQIKAAEINRIKFIKKLQLTRKQIKQTATNIQGDRK